METCEKSASIQIEAYDPTSISEVSKNFNVQIFQPAPGLLAINSSLPGNYAISIYNLKGSLLISETFSNYDSNSYQLNHNLRSGLYLIQLTNFAENLTFSQKIFIIE